jgi:choline dehydrogenase-like flavoprotein
VSHVAFQPRGAVVELEVDYCVVGSGAGGATAAVTLARGGRRVALVEAGPWRDPHDYPHSTYGAFRDMLPAWGTTIMQGRAHWPLVQGALVGGSTVVNSAIAVTTPDDVLAQWRDERGFEGGDALRSIQAELERELHVAEVPAASRGRSTELALQGAQRAGYESHVLRRYAPDCIGSGQCLQGCRAGRKQSLNENFVPEVLARGGSVLSCAPVARVHFTGARATGVVGRFRHPQTRAHGAKFAVHARHGVLVAASVVNTAPLLARSGVRHPALGEEFRSHPGAPVIGVYDEPVDMHRGATQGWGSTAFRADPGFKLESLSLPLDMVAGRLAGAGQLLMERLREFRHFALWIQATRANTAGRIRPGPFGRNLVYYTLGADDMRRFRAAMVALARTHVAAGARSVIPGIAGLPYELAPDELGLLEQAPLDPRAYVAVTSHLFGGCVMGRDPARSVCDPLGRVREREALLVVDASVIPSVLGVNPQHTIMSLARYFAEHMLDREKSE